MFSLRLASNYKQFPFNETQVVLPVYEYLRCPQAFAVYTYIQSSWRLGKTTTVSAYKSAMPAGSSDKLELSGFKLLHHRRVKKNESENKKSAGISFMTKKKETTHRPFWKKICFFFLLAEAHFNVFFKNKLGNFDPNIRKEKRKIFEKKTNDRVIFSNGSEEQTPLPSFDFQLVFRDSERFP